MSCKEKLEELKQVTSDYVQLDELHARLFMEITRGPKADTPVIEALKKAREVLFEYMTGTLGPRKERLQSEVEACLKVM